MEGPYVRGWMCAAALSFTLVAPATLFGGVFDLGNFGGLSSSGQKQSFASFINNAGDVAGYSYIVTAGAPTFNAFFYSPSIGSIQNIGSLGGKSSPGGMNASGEVTGTAYDGSATPAPNAFIYTYGAGMSFLGNLGGTNSMGEGINDGGFVVGDSTTAGNSATHAYLYTPGVGMVDDLTLGGSFGNATFINNNGQIAGNSLISGDLSFQGYYSSDGSTKVGLTLGSGNSSTATAINASGQVIGQSNLTFNGALQQAFVYTPGASPTMVNLGTAWSASTPNSFVGNSDALAINDVGLVVGQANIASGSSTHHAVIFSGGGMIDLGTTAGLSNSTVVAVNHWGEIVGMSTNGAGNVTDPWIYVNGVTYDLNTAAFLSGSNFTQLTTVTGINDLGQVIGQGVTTAGDLDGYILTFSQFAIPEPSTSGFILIGLAIFGLGAIRGKVR